MAVGEDAPAYTPVQNYATAAKNLTLAGDVEDAYSFIQDPTIVNGGIFIMSMALPEGPEQVGKKLLRTGSELASYADRANAFRASRSPREQIGIHRTIGIADYDIQESTGELISVSGEALRNGTVGNPTERFFTTSEVNWDRSFDAEVKILEHIAHQYADNPGVYRDITGNITLYTEKPTCDSCLGVIKQFEEMFPNINVQVLHD